MKSLALLAGCSALRHIVDEVEFTNLLALDIQDPALDPEVMQNQPAHWRKQWPEGNTDQGQRDDEVVLPEGEYRGRKWLQPVPVVEYNTGPLDDDILDSQAHLEHYESDFGLEHGLSKESYQDRGFAIVNSNDAAVKSVWL